VPDWTPPSVKSAAGYEPPRSLIDLFIGQEGTLGVVTKATLRLTDLPPDVFSVLAFFESRQRALVFMELARKASQVDRLGVLSPRCIEYFDHRCLDIARTRVPGVPDNATAALFCEQEIWDEALADDHLTAWWETLQTIGALADDTIIADDPPSRSLLLQVRHAIPAGINEEVVRNGMPKVGTDLAVPDAGLREMMDSYESAPLPSYLFGHLGDNHLHLNLLPTSEEELAVARAFYDELAAKAVALGGTVSAEHGIGKVKTKHLTLMCRPEVIEGFRQLKRHLDPKWILGRGTLFDQHAN
jgi:D-lactate dehydrogenase (cytochrome)